MATGSALDFFLCLDGREFDAYISVGKSVSDIKFAERNIVDVLQMKYNYKVLVDDDNLLPRLGKQNM